MNIYKKNFIVCLGLILICFFILCFVVILNANTHYFVTPEANGVNYWYTIKTNYVKSLNNKYKIVFVSGSSGLFGIKTEDIEKELKIPVVNFATHAGLQNYIFYRAKKILRSGDIVFLPLEYDNYTKAYDTISNTIYEYIISYDSEYFLNLSLLNKQKAISYLLFNKNKFYPPKASERNIDYHHPYYFLNKNGDIVAERTFQKKSLNNFSKREIIANNNNIELAKFLKWCSKNNIVVYAMPPSLWHEKALNTKEQQSLNFIKEYYKKNNVQFIGNPIDYFYDLDYTFDTNYHLNTKGQNINTAKVIKLIKNNIPNISCL